MLNKYLYLLVITFVKFANYTNTYHIMISLFITFEPIARLKFIY